MFNVATLRGFPGVISSQLAAHCVLSMTVQWCTERVHLIFLWCPMPKVRHCKCSDRAPGIVYFGYWFGTVGKYYTQNSLQTVVRGSLDYLVGCHE